METVADVELTKAINHAQKMLDAAIEVVGAAQVKLDQSWARNPKVIALAILCRSITNFRASLILVQQQQVLEARALVRLMYENLLWLAALRERGAAFVQAMIDDEAFNRKALAKRTLKLTAKQGADLSQPGASKLKSIIEDLEQKFPKTKKLETGKTAEQGSVEITYVQCGRFSFDAVHCSVTALARHISAERIDGTLELIVNVAPPAPPFEVLSTVLRACRALMGAAVAANELMGFTAATATLAALMSEFEVNGWQQGD
jgi:hypothetical protein